MTEDRVADAIEVAPFSLFEVRGYTRVAVAAAVVAILVALLLSGGGQVFAIVGIVFALALVVDCYRIDIDPSRREITVRTLWWAWFERRSAIYSFDDVCGLREAWGYDEKGYRLEFRDGPKFSLSGPIDPRLLRLFPTDSN